jgi:hypothetical protein
MSDLLSKLASLHDRREEIGKQLADPERDRRPEALRGIEPELPGPGAYRSSVRALPQAA